MTQINIDKSIFHPLITHQDLLTSVFTTMPARKSPAPDYDFEKAVGKLELDEHIVWGKYKAWNKLRKTGTKEEIRNAANVAHKASSKMAQKICLMQSYLKYQLNDLERIKYEMSNYITCDNEKERERNIQSYDEDHKEKQTKLKKHIEASLD